MGRAAELAIECRKPGETALDILDRICKPYLGCDAEFESTNPNDPNLLHPDCDDYCYPHPKMALGMLMLEAFAPNGVADFSRYQPMFCGETSEEEEMACDAFWKEIYEPFAARYNFC